MAALSLSCESLLGETNLSLTEIARRTGYESEAAFNRAFKRSVGQPPATWRRTVLHS
jgi:transcriptional regulator GlxA family with amidase domain